MKLKKDEKVKLLRAISTILRNIEVDNDFSIFKYHCNALFEEQEFLILRDVKTQLANDIYCK